MSQKNKTSVIIPCYNEEGNIRECAERILALNQPFEIIIVNDGSKDKTKEIAEEILENNENVRLVNLFPNRGKTQAIKEGIKSAAGDFIIIHDADMTVDVQCLVVFHEELQNNPDQFLMGTRFIYGMEKGAMPFKNYISNKITAKIFSYLLKRRVTDTLCGTKGFKKAMDIEFTECRWPDFDLIIAAKNNRLKIKEIPVVYLSRKAGASKMNLYPDVWQLMKRIARELLPANDKNKK
ncbi:MAG: glycosyltransferase family 2 protein [Candidatus Omnitrophica bacterium]|nr:glycosyltransferase family 2 protein [Candidatus Omnitrophota bacterium]